MSSRSSSPPPQGVAGRLSTATGLVPVALSFIMLAGCEINKPELPTFDTAVTLPLGVERLDVLEAVEGEDHLQLAPDGGLLFHLTGDPDTLALDYDLSVDIDAQTVSQSLGDFDLDAPAPLDYGFELQDVWGPSAAMTGLPVVVPPFPITVVSGDEDLPDVVSAELASGTATVTVTNGLAVPISADSGPDQLVLTLEDPATGAACAVFVFDEIPVGTLARVTTDLTGAVLPDCLRVRLNGGSAGSGGQFVIVSGTDAIDVHAEFNDLVVTAATAVVPAQSFTSSFVTDLPADYELTAAELDGGSLTVDLDNDLPLPCTAYLVWPELRDGGGLPLSRTVDLAPGAAGSATIDFAGYLLDGGGAPVSALTADISVISPGSGGLPVTVSSGDGLTTVVSGGTVTFGSVTGIVPEQTFELDPSEETVDLPDELDGLQMTAATLILRIDNSTGIAGRFDLTLIGVSSTGRVETLDVSEEIPASYVQAVNYITLDQTNSDIVAFINNLPESVSLAGSVSIGGADELGTVRPDDMTVIGWELTAPVEVVIDGASLDGDPQILDIDADLRDRISTHALGARIDTEIVNHLPFGLHVLIFAGQDTTTLQSDPLLTIGPLSIAPALVSPLGGAVLESVTSRPGFELTEAQARVFGLPGLYTQVRALLPSTDGLAVQVMSSDFIEVRGAVRLDILVDDDL